MGLCLSKFNPNENVKSVLTDRSHAEEMSSGAKEEEGEQILITFILSLLATQFVKVSLENCVDISVFCATVSNFEVHISHFAEISVDCFPVNLHCFCRSTESETDIAAPAYSLKAIFALRLPTFQILNQFRSTWNFVCTLYLRQKGRGIEASFS